MKPYRIPGPVAPEPPVEAPHARVTYQLTRFGFVVCVAVAELVGASCYSLTPQDKAAEQLDDAAQAQAYCHLARVTWDDDAGDVAQARAFIRAAHAGSSGILRRNSVADAGAADSGIGCAP